MTPSNADLETIWLSCRRHGQSAADADEVIESCLEELREGDSNLVELLLESARRELN
jgi:hypothetical protein